MNKLECLPSIHCISLEESIERRNNLETWFKKYQITNYNIHLFERFDENEYKLVGPYVHLLATSGKGAITSHFRLLKEWYETTNEPYTLIVEDDLSLETVEYWNFTWKEFFENLPDDWNCVQLILIREYFCGSYSFEKRKERDWCAGAYLIKREYVKLLLDLYYSDDIFNLEIKNLEYPPIIEHLLFTNKPGVYCFPLFVEDCYRTQSTLFPENAHAELINGQGPNHHSSYDDVMMWWRTQGVQMSMSEIFQSDVPFNYKNLKEKYKMNINGIIHVGAHYGEEVPDYIESGVTNIVLFEPLKENFDILSNRVKGLDGNIILHNTALGSTSQRSTMYVSDNEGQSSSLLKPSVHLTHHPNVYFTGSEEVNVNLLDCYDCKQCNYIHLDVQGYELEVLKGATETLKHIDYVYCEVNRDELYEGNAYVEEIDQFLKQYDMERVETYWMGEIWGDALYVKNRVNDYHRCLSHLKTKSSPVVIDVGCNINADYLDDFTEILFSMYPNAKCVGVESVFWNQYEKKWNDDSRVTLVKKALSNKKEKKTLYVPSIFTDLDHGLSSFYQRRVFDFSRNTQQIEVDCITLDDLFLDLDLEFIDYLKIDTEGSELPILQGCTELLKNKKIQYIQLEYGETYGDAGYTVSDVINFLKSYNYDLIFKIGKSSDNNMSGEMVFCKNESTTYNVPSTCQIQNLSSIYEKYFGYPSDGFFVEVGAYDGETFSNTSCLADHGWKGVYVEPVGQYYLQCLERHKNNDVSVVQCLIGDEEKETDIYICGGLTTSNEKLVEMYSEIDWSKDAVFQKDKCNQIRLETLFQDQKVTPGFNLLVVDVEGNEDKVFNSFDLGYWSPKMMIIELIDEHRSFQKYKDHIKSNLSLRHKILSSDYVEVYKDEINTVFVKRDLYNKK